VPKSRLTLQTAKALGIHGGNAGSANALVGGGILANPLPCKWKNDPNEEGGDGEGGVGDGYDPRGDGWDDGWDDDWDDDGDDNDGDDDNGDDDQVADDQNDSGPSKSTNDEVAGSGNDFEPLKVEEVLPVRVFGDFTEDPYVPTTQTVVTEPLKDDPVRKVDTGFVVGRPEDRSECDPKNEYWHSAPRPSM
jgi:hypothetical protein